MKNLIDKYIKRIKLDYPEDDKLMIDLQDFYREAQQQALILPVVGKSVKEKKLPKIEDYVTDNFYKLKGNQYLKKEDCTSWTIERIIEDYHRQIALQL